VRANILQVAKIPNGTLKVLLEAVQRAKIIEVRPTAEFIEVVIQDIPSIPVESSSKRKALWRYLYELFKEYMSLNDKMTVDLVTLFKSVDNLDYLADTVAVHAIHKFEERQKILETADLRARVLKISVFLENEIEVLKTEKRIKKEVQKRLDKHQKDYYLTEQMRAIQRELGRENFHDEIEEIRKRAKKLRLSKEAYKKLDGELKRLEQMQPVSPEASVIRHYVDWLISVPWYKKSKDNISIEDAKRILDGSHAGMKKVKDRVMEFISAKKFAGDKLKRAPILCLVGPPGVGKTSLAMSIAKSLGRKLVRISLGGMRDEAEIRGHRRTYVGAMPGKIMQAMKKAGVINPVIVLDEVDKMSMDFRGDPASALLEVLDPEQNHTFSDYFMEVDYDLSRVMFITTANLGDSIPYALLDRMEVIELSGYTETEKIEIATNFLLPKLIDEYALKKSQLRIGKKAIAKVVSEYTKEAGVRQLERTLAKIVRKSIEKILELSSKGNLSKKEAVAGKKKKAVPHISAPNHKFGHSVRLLFPPVPCLPNLSSERKKYSRHGRNRFLSRE
jgi:ATP-dependent Lon protease